MSAFGQIVKLVGARKLRMPRIAKGRDKANAREYSRKYMRKWRARKLEK